MPTVSVRTRLSIWYALAIGGLGALHPFLAMALGKNGLSPEDTAAVLALFPAGFLTAGLLWGWLADASGQSGRWMRAAAVISAVFGLVTVFAPGLPGLVAGLAGLALARAPLIPLVDTLTMRTLGEDSGDYGRVRAWGSVAFAAAVFSVGALIDHWPDAPLGITAVLLAGTAAMTWALPRARLDAPRATLTELRALIRDPTLRSVLQIAVLHGLAHATYDFLFSLHMERLGAPTWQTTAAFVAGLTVEVTLMAMAPALLRRLGATGMIRLAVFTAVPRFLLTGLALPTALIAAVQALHGVSFGAFWLGAVALIAARSPHSLRNSGQAALMAASAGVGPLCMMLAATWLLRVITLPQLFLVAAGLSVIAAGLAWRLARNP